MSVPSDVPADPREAAETAAALHVLAMRISPNPTRPGLETGIRYTLSRPAAVRLDVLDLSGRVVQSIEHPAAQPSGRLTWTGTDRQGRPVAAGIYFLRLQAEGSALAERRVIRLR